MPFRRERPLHERLAEEGGLDWRRQEERPHDPTPRWGGPGIHGFHRAREWDTVVSADSAALPGDEVNFAALADGSLVVDEDVPDGSLAALADAVETQLPPPYRAKGVRRGEIVWVVAANRIEVVELPEEPDGDELELGVHGGERALTVDGEPALLALPTLERLARERGLGDYVVRARRIDGPLWEFSLSPL